MSFSGSYSIVRYIPNPERDEPRNLGIVLASDKTGELKVRLASQPRGLWLTKSQREILKAFVNDLERQLSSQRGSRAPEEYLRELASELANSLTLTNPRPVEIDDTSRSLQSLYERFVSSDEASLPTELLRDAISAIRARRE